MAPFFYGQGLITCYTTGQSACHLQKVTILSLSTADITVEGIGLKVAPPIAVSGAVLFGMTPAQWITTLTLVYLIMSIGLLIPKYWAMFSEKIKSWNAARKAAKESENGKP